MEVIYTVPFGSRLYGTYTDQSDYDWKKVILPDLDDLLIGYPIKNQFFSSSSSTVKNTSDDTDTELIPLQTFARDVLAGQTYALEILFSVFQLHLIPGTTQSLDRRFWNFCRDLEKNFITSSVNAMVGYAYHQAELYSEKGNRLEKLHQFRHFLDWAMSTYYLKEDRKLISVMIATEHDDVLSTLFDEMLYITETKAHHGNMEKSYSVMEKLYPENITIAEALKRVDTTISKYGRRANQAMDNNGKDWKAISHAVRVSLEAVDILTNKWIQLPFSEQRIQLLKDIKAGLRPWEEVQAMLVSTIDSIAELQKTSTLEPASVELHERFELWLKQQMKLFYGV